VRAAVLSPNESKRIFGVDLAETGIQPVWLKIENKTDLPFKLLPINLDPDYFTPLEAAFVNYPFLNDPVNKAMDEYFQEQSLDMHIPPGEERSGFVYTNFNPGVKYVNIALYAPKRVENFVFTFEVPGIRTDYQRVDFESLYSEEEFIDYEDEDELRAALENLPCCTTKKGGTGENDPLNFVIIGEPDEIFPALVRRGWDVTEPIYAGSGWRAFKAFFSGREYKTAPMSSLYFYKRGQDIGLQKARTTIHERNHIRLWLTPMRFKGKDVWIGAISRDIGSYITWRTPWLTAHAIDPDIDEAINYLVQDLIFSQGLKKLGWVKGVRAATRDEPRRNFMNQPWWTNGLRAVFLLDSEPRTLSEVEFFNWERRYKEIKEIIEDRRRKEQIIQWE